ncbi:uncharacterized protein LOC127735423 [Mytilus californianus]|uniref:uncharacterized protein LOC127735423 n=1 Tax=Mytilus californianus TaxID=6549 RepID=UPI002247B4C2|nr:uncharacterized protein LOC127735423 [Mytilus californianus]
MFGVLQKIAVVAALALSLTEASHKKGLAVSDGDRRHRRCGDEKVFTNVHWWYDWHTYPWKHTLHKCSHNLKQGYVPMVWGWRPDVDTPIRLLSQSRYVLGFNEPNHEKQSKMSPREAARHWKVLQKKAHGKILVSPAVAPCASCEYGPIEWLDEFFKLCRHCRVDHIATHSYRCEASETMVYLNQLWQRYKKPIWLTEFACPQDKSAADQLQFMKQILPLLESADYVFRYSWFVSRNTENLFTTKAVSLLHQNSKKLTTLGKYYNDFDG